MKKVRLLTIIGDRGNPTIEEGEAVARVRAAINAIVELVFEEGVPVSVGCGICRNL